MIVLLRPDITPEVARAVVAKIRELGLDVASLDEGKGRAYEVVGTDPSRVLRLEGTPGIQEILTRRTPLVGGEPIWPHFVIRVTLLGIALLIVLFALTAFAPPGLGDHATAAAPEESPGVEWYLRPLDRLRTALPASLPWLGGWLVFLFWAVLFLWPLLERGDARTVRGRRTALAGRLLGAAAFALALLFAVGVL